jgi:hypothetical protein
MSMREVAKHLAAMGRHGDTTLVHMSPQEVSALHGIASINGTHLTTNPHTGLPEAFSLGGFFRSLLPTIVGAVAAPLTGGGSLIPVLAGAATGAALNGGNPLMGALMGGLGGFGGAGIGNAIQGTGAAAAVPTGTGGGVGAISNQSAVEIANAGGSAAGSGQAPLAGMSGTPGGAAPGSMNPQLAADKFGGTGTTNISGASTGAKTALDSSVTQSGMSGLDKFVQRLGGTGPNADLIAAGKVGIPLGMAGLAGIEPPQMPQEKEDKYDPYATLNLNTDSGLRFFAEGGDVKNVQSASGPPALRDAVNRINNSPNPVASALLGNFDTNSLRSSPNPGVDLFRAMAMGGLGRMGDINNMFRPESLGLFAKDSGARFAEGGDVNETPDPDSNPAEYQSGRYGVPMLNKAVGGLASFARGGYLDGPGDGMSDSIPATIEGKQPARLADGEFVVPADVVSHLGNGSTKAGAERLYAMMDKVRHARTGTTKQGRQINPKKYLPA